MEEKVFKAQFVASFLAAWAAGKYETACASGNHELLKHPPVEDAEVLAEMAWDEFVTKRK